MAKCVCLVDVCSGFSDIRWAALLVSVLHEFLQTEKNTLMYALASTSGKGRGWVWGGAGGGGG